MTPRNIEDPALAAIGVLLLGAVLIAAGLCGVVGAGPVLGAGGAVVAAVGAVMWRRVR